MGQQTQIAARPVRNGFAVTALVLGAAGSLIGLIPLLSPLALLLGTVGAIFGVLACVNARLGLSSKVISGVGLALSIIAVGLSVWGLTILVHTTQTLANDINALGSSPSVTATSSAPSISSDTSAPAPQSSSATPPAAPAYTPAGTYDVGANTGSTLDYQSAAARGRASIKDWIRSSKPSASIGPASGKRWVAFRIALQNTGTTPLGFNSLGFILIDKDGYRYPSGNAFGNITAGPSLAAGDLAPGEATTGYVVTEVPTDASITELKMADVYGNASWALK